MSTVINDPQSMASLPYNERSYIGRLTQYQGWVLGYGTGWEGASYVGYKEAKEKCCTVLNCEAGRKQLAANMRIVMEAHKLKVTDLCKLMTFAGNQVLSSQQVSKFLKCTPRKYSCLDDLAWISYGLRCPLHVLLHDDLAAEVDIDKVIVRRSAQLTPDD